MAPSSLSPRTFIRISPFGNPPCHLTLLRPLTSLLSQVRRACTLPDDMDFSLPSVQPSRPSDDLRGSPDTLVINPHFALAPCAWSRNKLTQHSGSAASLSLTGICLLCFITWFPLLETRGWNHTYSTALVWFTVLTPPVAFPEIDTYPRKYML